MGSAIQNKKVSFYNQQPARQIRLHSEQLVIDVIEVMLNLELYTMPVFYNEKRIGIIHFKDLIRFLTHREQGQSLIYHKLNYNVESVMVKMAQISESDYFNEKNN